MSKTLRALVTDEKEAATVTLPSVAIEAVNVVEQMEDLTLVGFNHISLLAVSMQMAYTVQQFLKRGSKRVLSKHG